jgi:anti-anti-sigma regulatory factor
MKMKKFIEWCLFLRIYSFKIVIDIQYVKKIDSLITQNLAKNCKRLSFYLKYLI